jgi:hypothetical protein
VGWHPRRRAATLISLRRAACCPDIFFADGFPFEENRLFSPLRFALPSPNDSEEELNGS